MNFNVEWWKLCNSEKVQNLQYNHPLSAALLEQIGVGASVWILCAKPTDNDVSCEGTT